MCNPTVFLLCCKHFNYFHLLKQVTVDSKLVDLRSQLVSVEDIDSYELFF